MFRRTLTTWMTAGAILAFAASPLLAQDKGARPNPGGSSSGGRTASGSGGGGDAGSSAGSSGSSSSGSSRGGGSSVAPGGFNTDFAPARPERRAEPRNTSGQRPSAANRDSSSSNGGEQQRRAAAPGATASASAGDAADGRRAVPAYARPRDGRPVTGTAYEHRPVGYPNNGYVYNPIYRYGYYNRYPYGYYYAGYGLGLGYFYDPFLWGYYSPYAYGYPAFYGGFPYYYGGGGGGSYGGGYTRESPREVGGLRLKVKPLNGQVYVDGYYVGEVDNFDGNFQRLQIEAGAHKVEIRADGFEAVQFDVMVNPGETVIYKGDMKRIQ